MSTSNVTLTATWTAKPLRSINYNLNGGRYDDKKLNPIQTSLASGSTFKIASGNELSKPGYSFGGWSDGTTTYAGGATYTIGNSNLLLSAIWIPRVYRITWNIKTNGGTRGGLLGALTYSVGVPVFTFPTDAQKVGKVFAGWYTSAKGGTKINSGYLVTAPYGEVTFYAQFR